MVPIACCTSEQNALLGNSALSLCVGINLVRNMHVTRRPGKYQTCLISCSQPREVNFSPECDCTHGETAELTTVRRAGLSSFLVKCGRHKDCVVNVIQLYIVTVLVLLWHSSLSSTKDVQ